MMFFIYFSVPIETISRTIPVLDLVSQVRDVVLMNVYLDLGDPRGSGFWNEGYRIWVRGGKWGDQFTSNLGTRWTGSYHSKEGSK
jgi:hypothetical protein